MWGGLEAAARGGVEGLHSTVIGVTWSFHNTPVSVVYVFSALLGVLFACAIWHIGFLFLLLLPFSASSSFHRLASYSSIFGMFAKCTFFSGGEVVYDLYCVHQRTPSWT